MFDPLVPILVFLVTSGVKEFCERVLGKPVPSAMSAIVAAFVAAGVLLANMLIALVPPVWLPVVGKVVELIIAIASAFGVHAVVKMVGGR